MSEDPLLLPPVLLLAFNRPDSTRRVVDAIRQARPTRLYVAVDGPRPDRPDDPRLCAQVRQIVTEVDWPCDVRTLFRDTNLGCRRAVSEAIDWFFGVEPEGIILEDDCLPHQDFFRYCAELIDRYRDDDRVMAISGCNFGPADMSFDHSYYFSRQPHIWGWATWRRAWCHYDHELTGWESRRRTGWLMERDPGHPGFVDYWSDRFDAVARGKLDSWGYVWLFSMWVNEGLTAVPTANLVTNIGFAPDALHTRDARSPLNAIPLGSLTWPLDHPTEVKAHLEADRWEDENILMPPPRPLVRVLKMIPGAYPAAKWLRDWLRTTLGR